MENIIVLDALEKFKDYEVQVIVTKEKLEKFESILDEKKFLYLKIFDSDNYPMIEHSSNANSIKNTIDCSNVLKDGKTLFTNTLPIVYKNIPNMIGLEIDKEEIR